LLSILARKFDLWMEWTEKCCAIFPRSKLNKFKDPVHLSNNYSFHIFSSFYCQQLAFIQKRVKRILENTKSVRSHLYCTVHNLFNF
jgi:hypothetical protein